MRPRLSVLVALAAALVLAGGLTSPSAAALRDLPTGAFAVEQEVVLPGTPEVIYDAITGDVSPWWDHSFSEKPSRFYLEARPGGGFYELFDQTGNGVKHASVIYADRGKLLRFEGPLGLSGAALLLVTTYTFEAVGTDSTRLKVEVHGSGEVQKGWPEAVDRTWKHFIVDRFKPWVEAGGHLRR